MVRHEISNLHIPPPSFEVSSLYDHQERGSLYCRVVSIAAAAQEGIVLEHSG
jgi:hypothetical protein